MGEFERYEEFHKFLKNNEGATACWIKYVEDVRSNLEEGKSAPHLDRDAISHIVRVEMDRRRMDQHGKRFEEDIEDSHSNQLAFYEELSTLLSTTLGAVVLVSLDSEIIAHNIQGGLGK